MYYGMLLFWRALANDRKRSAISGVCEILGERNDAIFKTARFGVRGDVIEVFPTYDDNAYRIELFGDEVDFQIDPLLKVSGARRSGFIPRAIT